MRLTQAGHGQHTLSIVRLWPTHAHNEQTTFNIRTTKAGHGLHNALVTCRWGPAGNWQCVHAQDAMSAPQPVPLQRHAPAPGRQCAWARRPRTSRRCRRRPRARGARAGAPWAAPAALPPPPACSIGRCKLLSQNITLPTKYWEGNCTKSSNADAPGDVSPCISAWGGCTSAFGVVHWTDHACSWTACYSQGCGQVVDWLNWLRLRKVVKGKSLRVVCAVRGADGACNARGCMWGVHDFK